MSSITLSSLSTSFSSDCNGPKQQQHRKRTRATAEQLAILEDMFAVNVSPNAKLRKQLSERLHMSERSIQIWFQNRRAKVKHLQKQAQLQMQQASIRAQVYQQQLWQHMATMAPVARSPAYSAMMRAQSADAITNNTTSSSSSRHGPYPSHPLLLQQRHESMPPYKTSPQLSTTHTCLSSASSSSSSSSSSVINNNNNNNDLLILSATTLVIGTWQRLALHATDLMCTFSQNAFQWHIGDGGLQFKIHIPVESIRAIEHAGDDEVHLDLLQPPLFYMLTDKVWTQCSDFSERMQASTFLRHTIKGAPESLRQDLLTLGNMVTPSISMRQLVRSMDPAIATATVPASAPTTTTTTMPAAEAVSSDATLSGWMDPLAPSFVHDYWPSSVPQHPLLSSSTFTAAAAAAMDAFFLSSS